MDLKVDPARYEPDVEPQTGILVRAQNPEGRWVNADIHDLDAPSLLTWLRSRGGENKWAESVVFLLLGFTHEEIPD